MSEDRISRAFDDLSRQARQANPDDSLGALMNPEENAKNRWRSLAAAAVVVLVLGSVAFALNANRSQDVVSPPGSTTVTTTGSAQSTVPTTGSTVPEQSTTTTTPDTSTTTTTTVVASPAVGWHVVDVASDDVLNVRQSPTASSPIVGTLAHNQDNVTVLPRAGNPIGDDAWYGVRLSDGTEGFVNSRYLAHPSSWDAGLAGTPCTAGTSSGLATASTPGNGDASAVVGLFQAKTDNCDRYVIVLGKDSVDVFETANTLGGGDVRVTSGGTRVTVELPSAITGVAPQATNADFTNALALTVLPINTTGGSDDLEVRFLHSSSRLAGVTVLNNPARIVIDVGTAPSGTGLDYAPVIGTGNTILEHPVDQSADKVGVGHSFSVTGYARWFEAQGYASIVTLEGARPTDIAWSGPSVAAADGNRASIYALYIPTWGEFTFTVDLPSGGYELFVGDDCISEVDDTSQPCGVKETFDVAP
ncbi:MAG: SH3 domain-containing protein [Acidimicrobiia bacterium]|nr:SH3 domain-containing protein [Acidimicrobiia bacterium]MDH5422070.1 SH3 domain-containing protein [Acidimicrobiia bacterium]MDH5505131.1 SH3 domain-containing protein [Acidimicrobiia bacterium]